MPHLSDNKDLTTTFILINICSPVIFNVLLQFNQIIISLNSLFKISCVNRKKFQITKRLVLKNIFLCYATMSNG